MTADPRSLDSLMQRYRAGLEPRDDFERQTFNEWRQLDADHLASALEARQLDDAYEHYDGPLSWSAWLADGQRAETLEDLGISGVELPPAYADALGIERSSQLVRQVENRLITLASSPLDREAWEADARKFGQAARALNRELASQVVDLEVEYQALVEEIRAVDKMGYEQPPVELAALQQRRGLIAGELAVLETRGDHPKRWQEQHGQAFVDALAAMHQFRREHEQSIDAHEFRNASGDAGLELDTDDGAGIELS